MTSAGKKAAQTKGPDELRRAALKAVDTKRAKGPDELRRAALMAAWTKKYGKDDANNPFSKANYPNTQRILETELPDIYEEFEASEGRDLLKWHKYKERCPELVRKRKAKTLKDTGYLRCEVCAFDFEEQFGNLGEDFIECHHANPVSLMKPNEKTKLSDLVLVCANCHRMLHRRGLISVQQLKQILLANKSKLALSE